MLLSREMQEIQGSGPAPSADVLQHGRGAGNGHSFQLGGVCAPASLGILLALKSKTGKEKTPPINVQAPACCVWWGRTGGGCPTWDCSLLLGCYTNISLDFLM